MAECHSITHRLLRNPRCLVSWVVFVHFTLKAGFTMASLRKTNGRWILQFTTPDKRRRTVRLGAIAKRDAESVKTHVETIISSAFAGASIPDDTARWLSRLNDSLRDKLARNGLVERRKSMLLGEFLEDYISRRDAKDSTKNGWRHSQRNLITFFGSDTPLGAVTEGNAIDVNRHWV